MLPSSWRNVQAALALRDYARKNATDKMIGHLCTTWSSGGDIARALLDDPKASDSAKQAAQALKAVVQGG